MLQIKYAYVTHPGLYRKTNQDNLICNGQYFPLSHGKTEKPVTGNIRFQASALFGVFDGMGGEEHGEAASWIAAKSAAARKIDSVAQLEQFCLETNRAICDYAEENCLTSSGTTASLLLFCPREIISCHLGDSRIYRWNQDRLEQLTKDDIWPGRKHMLLQCLGSPEEEMRISPHIDHYSLQSGSLFLLCSDGLSNMLPDDRIASVLSGSGDLETHAATLLDLALEAGGKDNITLLLIQPVSSSGFRHLRRKEFPPAAEHS